MDGGIGRGRRSKLRERGKEGGREGGMEGGRDREGGGEVN